MYVRNLPTTVSAAEIEEEFKNFGKIVPDGVVIRSRKVHYWHLFLTVLTCFLKYILLTIFIKKKMCRMLVYVMHLLNLKIWLVFILQSRSDYMLITFKIASLICLFFSKELVYQTLEFWILICNVRSYFFLFEWRKLVSLTLHFNYSKLS